MILLNRAALQASFAEFRARDAPASDLRRAAVAIVLGEDQVDGVVRFLLTQRPTTLSAHPGQFALPGGKLDPGETHVQAVVREVGEEVGLTITADDVVGRLDDYQTRSGYVIRPFVVWTGHLHQAVPSAAEVATLLRIPAAALTGSAVPTLLQLPGGSAPILQMPLGGGRVVHAPTGALLYQFAGWAFSRRYIDMTSFAEPEFAWR